MDEPINIVWLKRDLRIEDHAALFSARKCGKILAVYIIEPEYWSLPDTSHRQWQFIEQSLEPLKNQMAKLGIPLLFFKGDAVEAFQNFTTELNIASIHSHQETGNLWTFKRDLAVGRFLKSKNIPWHEHMQHGVFRALDTRNGWANRWDTMMGEAGYPLPARQEWPTSEVEKLSQYFLPGILRPDFPVTALTQIQKGGRNEGISLLASFLGGRGENYSKAMSSPLEGADACSRISAHLAYGTLSMRETFHAAVEKLGSLDKENPANKKCERPSSRLLVACIGIVISFKN